MKKNLLLLTATMTLTGCVGAFVLGAATGSAIVYDKRSVKNIAADQELKQKISLKIVDDPSFHSSHIEVSSFNRSVLLIGQTPQASLRAQAQQYAEHSNGVKRVFNEISIANPTSAATRSHDAWLTTKVKSALLAEEGLKSGLIKVITENSVVYLMGIVSHHQADLAVNTARRVDGVDKIVKVFEYQTVVKG